MNHISLWTVSLHCAGVVCAYRLVDVEPGGHSPEDGRVQILRTIGRAHYDHLERERDIESVKLFVFNALNIGHLWFKLRAGNIL